jgi:Holliday junction resolvasome RuvABC endonuclease subunit
MIKIVSIDVGIKNLSYCILESAMNETKITEWGNICVTEENCARVQLESLVEQLLVKLAETFDVELQADVVLIENQPMLKNGMMKTIAVVIYTFFNLMKVQFGNIHSVKFTSATNKLKCKKARDLENDAKTTYKDRKKLSVLIAREYIKSLQPDKLEWFGSQRKQDDLADSLCQGIYHIESVLKHMI